MNIVQFTPKGNELGSLIALEAPRDVPFEIQRVYYIYGTQPGVRRGRHAHRNLSQLAICVSGSCIFMLDDGRQRREYVLDRPARGLLIGSMVWREMYDFTADCVLLVLASRPYDEADYIRDYGEFLALVSAQNPLSRP